MQLMSILRACNSASLHSLMQYLEEIARAANVYQSRVNAAVFPNLVNCFFFLCRVLHILWTAEARPDTTRLAL